MSATEHTGLEPVIDPDLPIIDPHHHVWMQPEDHLRALAAADNLAARAILPNYSRHARYLLDEYLADAKSGHNVRATVFMETFTMYKTTGPKELRSVGEVEFANGVGAMAASGAFGDIRVASAIVGGGIPMNQGDAVKGILEKHMAAAGGRYRGIRDSGLYDSDTNIAGAYLGKPHLYLNEKFRAGFRHLQPLGLSFDAFVMEPQLPDVVDLARAFPETKIILDHLGTPIGVGQYAGKRQERFPIWKENIRALAKCPNVSMKLTGVGMFLAGFGYETRTSAVTSQQLADDWRPYIEASIEAFGVERCMFGSNFPVDAATCSFRVLWNAFKRITSGATKAEKDALYYGTAKKFYRLDV